VDRPEEGASLVSWRTIGYALACVLVPVAWGLVVVWVSNRLEARIRRRGGDGQERDYRGAPMYHI
jgi:hypothetical protein